LAALEHQSGFSWIAGGSVFDSLVGTSSVRIAVEHGASVDGILASEAPAIARWRAEIRPFLLTRRGRRVAIERNVDLRIAALVDRPLVGRVRGGLVGRRFDRAPRMELPPGATRGIHTLRARMVRGAT
jgi:hypothetical protein